MSLLAHSFTGTHWLIYSGLGPSLKISQYTADRMHRGQICEESIIPKSAVQADLRLGWMSHRLASSSVPVEAASRCCECCLVVVLLTSCILALLSLRMDKQALWEQRSRSSSASSSCAWCSSRFNASCVA